MSKLNEFFEKLGSDSDLMDAYKKDPEGVMKANGLTDEEIATVMSGDTNKLKSLSGDQAQTRSYILVNSHNNKK
ncbi:hypothetical protein FM038_016260 [Shewanella eurypsychrophilus]|uniref:Extradiol ring-cleavage dioxygenase LigAB LigA subunit domain-containing protein n=1 Tax=Shewanella eurypsychrophilus TaxID=2593656 RepID=A0ABX6V9V5_9GAMM|nr:MULTISPECIES: hypothetical protein [Shewanella]QFU23575.1 hypothetical protein FS418_18060 [Shewanella sp. YLB-09]QPG58799.1 hypothetical protein FM038_016260 [Shewanella eurypsychrophilus]